MSDNIPEQKIQTSWLDEEAAQFTSKTALTGEKLESLKLEAGKIVKFTVDFSNKFNVWTSPDGVTKKIIPVTHKGVKKNLWLNQHNPLYKQIVERGKKGQKDFAVSTVGTQKDTRYTIVDEE